MNGPPQGPDEDLVKGIAEIYRQGGSDADAEAYVQHYQRQLAAPKAGGAIPVGTARPLSESERQANIGTLRQAMGQSDPVVGDRGGLNSSRLTDRLAALQPGQPGGSEGTAGGPTEGQAFAKGLAEMGTFGWSGPLAGAWTAVTPKPLREALGMAEGETMADRYRAGRDKSDAEKAAVRAAHPHWETAGELTAGLLMPMGAAAGAAPAGAVLTRGQQLANMATQGAKIAGLYGAGQARGPLLSQVVQTGTSALTGAALPLLVGGATNVAGDLAETAAEKIPPLREWMAKRAAKTVSGEAQQRALAEILRGNTTPGELAAKGAQAADAGISDVWAADLTPNLQGAADWVASVPGRGQTAIKEAVEERAGAMRPTLIGAFQKAANRAAVDPHAALGGLDDEMAKAGRAMFEPIFAQAAPGLTSPDAIEAVRAAMAIPGVKSEAIKLATARKVPLTELFQVGAQEMEAPTPRFAHYLKTALQNMAEGELPTPVKKGNKALAYALFDRAREINDALTGELGQPYADALAKWSGLARQKEAVLLGAKVFSPKMTPGILSDAVAKMAPEERQAFYIGADAAARRFLQKAPLGAGPATAWWNDPEIQAKIQAILPEGGLPTFLEAAKVTADKMRTNAAGMGSQSLPRFVRDQDMGEGVGSLLWDFAKHPTSAARGAIAMGKEALDRRAKERLAEQMPAWLTLGRGGPEELQTGMQALTALQQALGIRYARQGVLAKALGSAAGQQASGLFR